MQTTFIVKNLTSETIDAISAMASTQAYEKLSTWAFGDLKHCVSIKCGSGQFRDRVDWNSAMRDVKEGKKALNHKIEPRKGYKLFTFWI